MSVPLGFSEIPQILGGHVSLVSVTTTLMLPIQKPVTRRREGASSACTTQKGTIASSASMDTTVMLFGRTAEVRCTFIQHAHSTTTTDPLFSGFCCWGTYFSLFSETKFHSQQMKDETGFFFSICKSSFFGKTKLKMWLCARGNCGCHQDKGHAVECVVVWSFHELADWVGLRDLNYHCGWATPF